MFLTYYIIGIIIVIIGATSNLYPEPTILCGGTIGFWETQANFALKSVHFDQYSVRHL